MAYLDVLKLGHFQTISQNVATTFPRLRGLVRCNWEIKVVQDLKTSNEDLKVPRSFYVYTLWNKQSLVVKIKTDVPMVYNRRRIE